MKPEEHAAFMQLLKLCPAGPRIEFGVFRGATLALIAQHSGETIGVDSFEGMAAPGPRDEKDGWCPYPKGRLAVGPVSARRTVPNARLIEGFVPAVLAKINASGFGFAHIDMDQFEPTLAALRWLAYRMIPGGIICCDDWFADRDWLAAGAINGFVAERGISPSAVGRKIWWIHSEHGEPLN